MRQELDALEPDPWEKKLATVTAHRDQNGHRQPWLSCDLAMTEPWLSCDWAVT